MSGWTFSAQVNTAGLDRLIAKLGTVSGALEEVADETAEVVRENIRNKNIIDTGALLESIDSGGGVGVAYVRDGVPYGVYNEFGTSRMAARPFFVPALEKAGEIIAQKFTELLK